MKISICTPHYADVTADYTMSLWRMILWTARADIVFNGEPASPEIEVFMRRSTILPRCRNALAKDAVDWGANYLLWVDADHSFPPDSLVRLLSLNLPIVGVNSARRTRPTWPTAVALDGQLIWTTEELAQRGEVEQVRHPGLGFCLMDMNVIHTLRAPGPDGAPKPLFALEMIGEGLEVLGEDAYFFKRAREAGIAVYVDHGLSWHVAHVHSQALTIADALTDKDELLKRYNLPGPATD